MRVKGSESLALSLAPYGQADPLGRISLIVTVFRWSDKQLKLGERMMRLSEKLLMPALVVSSTLSIFGSGVARADIVTDQLSLWVDARVPGPDSANTWQAIVGTDGDLIDLNDLDPFDHTPVLTTSGPDSFYQTSFLNDVGGSQVDFGANHMFDWDESFTYEAYIRPHATPLPGQAGRGMIMGNQMKNSTGASLRIRDGDADGIDYRLEFEMRDNEGAEKGKFEINTSEGFAFGDFHHIVMTYAGMTGNVPIIKIYVDGNVVSGTQGGNQDLTPWTTEFDFINQANNRTSLASRSTPSNTSFNSGERAYVEGDYVFARIYGKALSQAEIQQNYQNLNVVPEPSVGLMFVAGLVGLNARRKRYVG